MKKLPMNLPNKITIARILMIPLYLILMAVIDTDVNWLAAIVFTIAAATDWLDGQIARKRNLVTDFGKFMDPIADKLLVLLPMIQLLAMGRSISLWAVLIMTAREITVSGFRLVAVTKGNVIAAGWTGKVKTTVQMVAVIMLTLGMVDLGYLTSWIAAVLSLYSGAEIIVKNREVLEEIG